MARAHFVKKARKHNPAVNKGESYFWWQFKFGRKQYSKTSPKPSQLTQSDYLGQFYAHQEQFEELDSGDSPETLANAMRELAGEIEQLGVEQEEKVDNMPDGLQEGNIGELLRQRAETCETLVNELEDAADRMESAKEDKDESEKLSDHIQGILDEISWEPE